MQIQRIIKGGVPISIFGLPTVGKEKLPSAYVTVADIKGNYSDYKEDLTGMHTHDFYLLSWITDGYCDYNVDMNGYKIRPNTLLLLKPGELHYYSNVNDIKGVNFYFTSDVLSNVSFNISTKIDMELFGKNHIIPVTSDSTKEMLKQSSDHLKSLCNTSCDGIFSQEIKKLEMLILLLKLLECDEIQCNIATSVVNRNTHPVFLQFQKMVDDKYQSLHKVQEYSGLLNISSKHLTECVRENAGKTPLQIINQRLVLQSQRLLLFSRLSIKEIALTLGFTDTSHFVKFFKNKTGMTPSDYRTEINENVP